MQDLRRLPPEALSDELLITKRFRNSTEFSQHIERECLTRKISCLEILTEYCEQQDLDAGTVAGMITPALKEKLRVEAEELNLLTRTSGTLPI